MTPARLTSGRPPKHPAPYSVSILGVLSRLVRDEQRRLGRPVRVLDPFAGVGRIHRLAVPGRIETVGIELEPEWAATHADTICADAIDWCRRYRGKPFDLIVTSPTYGNRMADHHEAKDGSTRRSYVHDLGRRASTSSSCELPWGPRYWSFHATAVRSFVRVLRKPAPARGLDTDPEEVGGLVLWNVSNFYRGDVEVHAVQWHHGALAGAGFEYAARPYKVPTPRMTKGANRKRADGEVVLRYRRAS